MARSYTLKQRAEKQAETRLRIVEAAVELHSSIGPAGTNFSMVAERAGVQRRTLYAHFPDEWSLLLACSGLTLERDPLPSADAWRSTPVGRARLEVGLSEVYGWYERNADLAGCVLRDAEAHAPTRKITELRMGPFVRAYHDVLGEGLSTTQRPMLAVGLSFFTWRTLVRDSGLDCAGAVAGIVRAIEAQV